MKEASEMETDERGVLSHKELDQIAQVEYERLLYIIARTQHDHGVAVVRKCYKTPGGIVFPDFQQGWNAAIECVLLALKDEQTPDLLRAEITKS